MNPGLNRPGAKGFTAFRPKTFGAGPVGAKALEKGARVLGLLVLLVLADLLWPRSLPSMREQRFDKWSNLWLELRHRDPAYAFWSYRAQAYRYVMGMQALEPGHYPFKGSTSTFDWLRTMNAGRQIPVRLVLSKMRTPVQLAAFLSRKLRADSVQWMQVFCDSLRLDSHLPDSVWLDSVLLASVAISPQCQIGLFLPNAYEVYWTVKPEDFRHRMLLEFRRFWTPRRLAQCKRLGLSPMEAIALASIVEEETQHQPERPTIAGVYLNRLRIGMPLQADPTLKFAAGDFSLRRIGREQIAIQSPYNTYKVRGLPPAPICTPSVNAIDAVLQNQKHPFLYFCADPDNPGTHRFASGWAQHLQNARDYHRWLNRRAIR
jgi:UPF0755 protein